MSEHYTDTMRLDKLIKLVGLGQAEVSIGEEIWHGRFLRDQIDQELEKEAAGRLEWEHAPFWANFKAQDVCGDWYWYAARPSWDTGFGWVAPDRTDYAYITQTDVENPSSDSLEQRP